MWGHGWQSSKVCKMCECHVSEEGAFTTRRSIFTLFSPVTLPHISPPAHPHLPLITPAAAPVSNSRPSLPTLSNLHSRTSAELKAPISAADGHAPDVVDVEAGGGGKALDVDSAANKEDDEPEAKVG